MTIVVNVEELPLEQVTKQLNKLVNVLKIVELDQDSAVQRELLLVKVRADHENRSAVLEVVELFRAKVVDVAVDTVTIEATGSRDKLEALLRVLEPLRRQGARAVGHGRGGPRLALDLRPQPAPRRPVGLIPAYDAPPDGRPAGA